MKNGQLTERRALDGSCERARRNIFIEHVVGLQRQFVVDLRRSRGHQAGFATIEAQRQLLGKRLSDGSAQPQQPGSRIQQRTDHAWRIFFSRVIEQDVGEPINCRSICRLLRCNMRSRHALSIASVGMGEVAASVDMFV